MTLILHHATMFVSDIYRKIDPYYLTQRNLLNQRPIVPPSTGYYSSSTSAENDNTDGEDLVVHYHEIFEDFQGRLFRVIDFVGKGSYSIVYKCEFVNSPGHFVAIKISKDIPRLQKRLKKEAKLLQLLQSKTSTDPLEAIDEELGQKLIPEFISFFPISGHACLAIGLYQRTLLERFMFTHDLHGKIIFIQCIMRQILQGLKLIHSRGYVHGDLKPDNIILVRDDSYDIKFIDFGSAKKFVKPSENAEIISENTEPQSNEFDYRKKYDVKGNITEDTSRKIPQPLCYKSPEMILGLPYDEKIDIWSAGCILIELILGFPIFVCHTENDVIGVITKFIGPIPQVMIVRSQNWKHFYMPTPRGFMLIKTPLESFLDGHLFQDKFGFEDEEGRVEANFEISSLESIIRSKIQAELGKNITDSLLSLAYGLLDTDPTKRWSASEALKHSFLREEFNEETIKWTNKRKRPYQACSSHSTFFNPYQFGDNPNSSSLIISPILPDL